MTLNCARPTLALLLVAALGACEGTNPTEPTAADIERANRKPAPLPEEPAAEPAPAPAPEPEAAGGTGTGTGGTGEASSGGSTGAGADSSDTPEAAPEEPKAEPKEEKAAPKPKPKPKPDAKPEPKPEPVAKVDGRRVYMAKCKGCHGADGKGQTKMGRKHEIDDMTVPGWDSKWPVSKIVKIVTNGKSGTKMKAFKSKLTPEEIQAVSVYTRKL